MASVPGTASVGEGQMCSTAYAYDCEDLHQIRAVAQNSDPYRFALPRQEKATGQGTVGSAQAQGPWKSFGPTFRNLQKCRRETGLGKVTFAKGTGISIPRIIGMH